VAYTPPKPSLGDRYKIAGRIYRIEKILGPETGVGPRVDLWPVTRKGNDHLLLYYTALRHMGGPYIGWKQLPMEAVEDGDLSLCPSCEKQERPEDDYICEGCRYGG
jgi:hypothetical protein